MFSKMGAGAVSQKILVYECECEHWLIIRSMRECFIKLSVPILIINIGDKYISTLVCT